MMVPPSPGWIHPPEAPSRLCRRELESPIGCEEFALEPGAARGPWVRLYPGIYDQVL